MNQPTGIDKLNQIQITALEAAANGVVITDHQGVIIWVNPAVTLLTGYTREELENQSTSIFKSDRHSAKFYQDLWNKISAGEVWRGEVVNKRKDGSLYHEDMTITPVTNDAGKITHYIAIKQDITALRTAIDDLRQSDERFRLLINSVNAHFYISEISPLLGLQDLFLSENIVKLTGYPLHHFLGDWKLWQEIIHPEDLDCWIDFTKKISEGFNREIEYRIIRKDGEIVWLNDNAQLSRDLSGRLMIYGTVTDITDRKRTETRIRHLASHDPLTNLPNRIMFQEILENAISYSKRNRQLLGVFFLDVNDFKSINDTYGHHIGDQVLIEIANRLRKNLREYDTVSRISGDEFTLITQQLKQFDHSQVVAKKIYRMLSGEYLVEDHRINISVSVGGSIFPEHGKDIETLIRLADEAMYQAKNSAPPHFKIYDPNQA